DSAGGFIQNKNRRIGENRPCNGQQLTLTMAQVMPFHRQLRIISVCQLADEAVSISQSGCRFYFLVGSSRLAVTDVFPYRIREQVSVLQHDAQLSAEPIFIQPSDIHSVNLDRSFMNVIEP